MVESSRQRVVITGISGFLGSQVCNQFLTDGTFIVRGTVRDTKNEKKIAPLRKAFGEYFDQLELVEADLLKPESLDAAVQGCDYVVHTASPFPIVPPKDENELIRPAVEGTMAVVKACHKYRVKRVVITSSIAAIMYQLPQNMKVENTENDWSDVKNCGAYERSKTLAERAAWDFMHSLPAEERFELVTINPSLIMGPSLVQSDFSSGQVIQQLMSGKYPGMPKVLMPVVDVRDVAFAHLQGIKVAEARNKRFILSSQSLWFREISQALKTQYPTGYKINVKDLSYCPVKMMSFFSKEIKMILPFWNMKFELINTQSREVLGIQYRSGQEAILAMAESMIQSGLLPDKRPGAPKPTKK